MAAPKNNRGGEDQTRAKIRTTQLVNRLQRFALAEPDVEIDKDRLKAIEILLRKTLPDLSNVDAKVTATGKLQIVFGSDDANL